jgi:hypothetical protein
MAARPSGLGVAARFIACYTPEPRVDAWMDRVWMLVLADERDCSTEQKIKDAAAFLRQQVDTTIH